MVKQRTTGGGSLLSKILMLLLAIPLALAVTVAKPTTAEAASGSKNVGNYVKFDYWTETNLVSFNRSATVVVNVNGSQVARQTYSNASRVLGANVQFTVYDSSAYKIQSVTASNGVLTSKAGRDNYYWLTTTNSNGPTLTVNLVTPHTVTVNYLYPYDNSEENSAYQSNSGYTYGTKTYTVWHGESFDSDSLSESILNVTYTSRTGAVSSYIDTEVPITASGFTYAVTGSNYDRITLNKIRVDSVTSDLTYNVNYTRRDNGTEDLNVDFYRLNGEVLGTLIKASGYVTTGFDYSNKYGTEDNYLIRNRRLQGVASAYQYIDANGNAYTGNGVFDTDTTIYEFQKAMVGGYSLYDVYFQSTARLWIYDYHWTVEGLENWFTTYVAYDRGRINFGYDKVDLYQVKYTWSGLPSDMTSPTVPTDSHYYLTAAIARNHKDAKYYNGYQVEGSDGYYYTFSGWDNGTESGHTVTFSGSWTRGSKIPSKWYTNAYSWTVDTAGVTVSATLPTDTESYLGVEAAKSAKDATFSNGKEAPGSDGYYYTFSGWSDGTVNGQVVNYTGTWTKTDKKVESMWYTVAYEWTNADNLSETLPTDNGSYLGSAAAIAAMDKNYTSTTTRTGSDNYIYTFSGWSYTVDETSHVVRFTGNWVKGDIDQSTTWRAVYSWTIYDTDGTTVKNDVTLDGVTTAPTDSTTYANQTAAEGSTAGSAYTNSMQKSGSDGYYYQFSSWTTSANTTSRIVTFTGKWVKTNTKDDSKWVTITYTDNAGDDNVFEDVTHEILKGTVPPAFTGNTTRTGYTFTGWNPDNTQAVNADTTFAAQWSPNTNTAYTVLHYQKDLGADTYTVKERENLTGTTGAELTLSTLAKYYEGFSYVDGFAGTEVPGSTTSVTKPESGAVEKTTVLADGTLVISLYYTRDTYTVTYKDGVNGSVFTDDVHSEIEYGATTPGYTSGTPSRAGYSFQGWDKDIAETVTADATYTATWSDAISYTITYNLDGGALDEGVTNPDTYTVESDDITLNNPTKDGYNFLGWTGNDLTAATTDVTIAKGSVGNRTYTAHWQKKTDWSKLRTDKALTSVVRDGEELDDVPETLLVGDVVTYTITITNGTGTAVSEQSNQDVLDDSLEYVSATAPEGATVTADGQTVTWTGISIAADGTAKLTVTAKIVSKPAEGKLQNTAKIIDGTGEGGSDLPDPIPTPPVVTPVDHNWDALTIDKSASVTTVKAGDDVTYYITVSNNTGETIDRLVVTDDLDENLVDPTSDDKTFDADTVSWTLTDLADGDTVVLTLTATVKADVAAGTEVTNNASITEGTISQETQTFADGEKTSGFSVTVAKEGAGDPPVTISKVITGDKPKSDSVFTFVMEAETEGAPEPLRSVAIKGEGTAEFGDITFTEPGTYVYRVYEQAGDARGYAYDSTVYYVTYEVDENLNVVRTFSTENGQGLDSDAKFYFENDYDASSKKATVKTSTTKTTVPNTGEPALAVSAFAAVGTALAGLGLGLRRRNRR